MFIVWLLSLVQFHFLGEVSNFPSHTNIQASAISHLCLVASSDYEPASEGDENPAPRSGQVEFKNLHDAF